MSSSVKDYYQRNTGLFLRLGGGRSTGSIHRPLWGPDVTSTDGALTYAYRLVEQQIDARLAGRAETGQTRTGQPDDHVPLRVLDLGCGVGGALHYLAGTFGARIEGTGITISPEQARLARQGAKSAGTERICRFEVGDFHALPQLPPVDIAFSIEAFVQGRNPEQYFTEAFSALRPGGRLILIDDFECDTIDRHRESPQNLRILERFEKGWHAAAFGKRSHIIQLAESCGFRILEDENLAPLLKLGRPRDRFIEWFVTPLKPFIWWHPYGRSLVGGDALQKGLRKGLIEYRKMVFEKP